MWKIWLDIGQSKPKRNCKRANGRVNTACMEPQRDNFLLGLFFDTDDEGNTFLQNDEVSPSYMALQPRRPSIFVFGVQSVMTRLKR
jgi:hypothetical protein